MAGKIISYRALARRVLVVAVTGGIRDWSAYIDAVPGINHGLEACDVADRGNKISREMATLIFPLVASQYRWRD
jgi:hypothetical protein